jgi:hypothetical protein
VDEGAVLEKRCRGTNLYRGFESHSLRQCVRRTGFGLRATARLRTPPGPEGSNGSGWGWVLRMIPKPDQAPITTPPVWDHA